MGLFGKLGGLINPPENDDYYEDEDDIYDDLDSSATTQQSAQQNSGYTQQPATRQSSSLGGALEMKVVRPDKYDSATAQKIADHLLSDRTVVLNLEATNKEHARRLIDFLSGVAYSIDGYIQRVANNTFVIVPKNVDVSGEQLQEVRKQEDTDLY